MNAEQNIWSAKRPLSLGFVALVLLVAGLGVWSVKTDIAGAVVTSGLVEVKSNRQIVQHPNGGVIEEILIEDGDYVEAGDILIRFDTEFLHSDLRVTTEQLLEIMARKSRLVAERDGAETARFDQVLQRETATAVAAELVAGQNNLFLARKNSLAREEALLNERRLQIEEQIIGAEAQSEALVRQLELLSEELVDEESLLEKGLSQASRVRALKREVLRLEGLKAGLIATIAERRGRIAEIEIEGLRLGTSRREEAITTLRDLQYREIELRERQNSLQETLQRMDVRAPSSGVIYGKQFHALRSVVGGADTILYIVPQDAPLVISIRIPTIHIDQIYVGQIASIHFSAFDTRTTPVIMGQVTRISADVFVDDVTAESYYAAEIALVSGETDKLSGLEIIPGMPVEVFVKTVDRTPLEYLMKPLVDYFKKAFREN
ncbi:RTX toxin [Rhodobacterales bacterium 52_120_T64]|nr:RTX toxin [Rhodobacterales bacterium 52_120_T64]